MKKSILTVACAYMLFALFYSNAFAAIPVAVMGEQGEQLAHIAAQHNVCVAAVLAANPGLSHAGSLQSDMWVTLPAWAKMPDHEVFALSAPSEYELMYLIGDGSGSVPGEVENITQYRIMGRIFYLGEWADVPVVVFATGGNMNNPAIAVTLGAQNFNIKRLSYQGIGGGGHGVNIGDVLVASGVVPYGHGNLAPLLSPSGDVIIGEFWSYYSGVPIISDAGTVGRSVLTPDEGFMSKVDQSAVQVQLDTVNQEVADYLTEFFDLPDPATVYPSEVRIGWTSTGPFVTSDLFLTQLEERASILAGLNSLQDPEYMAVDMEDYGAIHAAVEAGITDWVVLRGVSDLARERNPGMSATAGIPWTDRNALWQPWGWISENLGELGWFEDYYYFVRQTHHVLKQIVTDWGLN